MKKILLAILFCLLSIFTFANDWEFGSEGEHIIPLKGSNVAIKKEKITLKLTKDEENNRIVLGISPKYKKINLSTIESLDFAKNSFNSIITDTVKGFFTLFSGKVSLKEVSGPVGIFKVVGEVSKFGWLSIVSLCVVLSINIGVLNLLPIPALDGGRIIFVLLELFGIKVNKKWEEKLHKGGMILLLFFILMISVNDVWKLFN